MACSGPRGLPGGVVVPGAAVEHSRYERRDSLQRVCDQSAGADGRLGVSPASADLLASRDRDAVLRQAGLDAGSFLSRQGGVSVAVRPADIPSPAESPDPVVDVDPKLVELVGPTAIAIDLAHLGVPATGCRRPRHRRSTVRRSDDARSSVCFAKATRASTSTYRERDSPHGTTRGGGLLPSPSPSPRHGRVVPDGPVSPDSGRNLPASVQGG